MLTLFRYRFITDTLDTLPKILFNTFKLKKCLLRGRNTVKKSDRAQWIYFCYGMAFAKSGSWSFGCNFVRNVIIFSVDNRLLSHSDNRKNN